MVMEFFSYYFAASISILVPHEEGQRSIGTSIFCPIPYKCIVDVYLSKARKGKATLFSKCLKCNKIEVKENKAKVKKCIH
jgi:hypothetical protein